MIHTVDIMSMNMSVRDTRLLFKHSFDLLRSWFWFGVWIWIDELLRLLSTVFVGAYQIGVYQIGVYQIGPNSCEGTYILMLYE